MGLQMMHGRPCSSPSSPPSSSSWMMIQAQPPRQSRHSLNGNYGRPISCESLAVLAIHLLLKRRKCHTGDTARARASSSGVLQIAQNKPSSSSLKTTKADAERTALDGALGRIKQLGSLNEEMSYWTDMGYTNSSLQFTLLLQNLEDWETSLAGNELVMLEKDILGHIQQLGALRSFEEAVSRATLGTNASHESDCALLDRIIQFDSEAPLQEQDDQVIVRSGRSQERKLKRMKASEKGSGISVKVPTKRRPRKSSSSQFISEWKNYPGRRRTILREQSALLVTIQECASLEKMRESMAKEEGQAVSYERWAMAAGLNEAELRSRLQAGCCSRERLLVTTEWLVKYIARTYTGMGAAFDDLLQAGKMGVLDGAEKFDRRKGCKFSTYVKYWIRKAMLTVLVENSGVTQLPARMESLIRKVKEARRAIRYSEWRSPSDSEVAAMVGASVAHVRLARKCSRRAVSLYSEIGTGPNARLAEMIPDTSAAPPDEALFRRQLRERLLVVLERLPPREGRVMRLRHGLEDGRCRSLEHIGAVYGVSKEWVRKIEKSAMAKLRSDAVLRELTDFRGLLF